VEKNKKKKLGHGKASAPVFLVGKKIKRKKGEKRERRKK